MRTLRRLTAFSLAATVLIVACGGDEVSAAQRLVLGAAQRTFTAETAQVAFVIDGLDDPVWAKARWTSGRRRAGRRRAVSPTVTPW